MTTAALSLGSVLGAPMAVLEKSEPVYHRIYAPCSAPPENDIYDYSLIEDVYTRDECKADCTEQVDYCTAYNYREDGKKCWKYHYTVNTAHSEKNGGTGETCVVKQMDGEPYHRFYGLCRKNEQLDATTEKSSTSGISKDACKELCSDDQQCKAYQYSPTKETCELNYSVINFIEEAKEPDTVCVIKF